MLISLGVPNAEMLPCRCLGANLKRLKREDSIGNRKNDNTSAIVYGKSTGIFV